MTTHDDSGVAAVLSACGWTPERRVATDADEAALIADGYSVWPSLRDFLASYSGISIAFVRGGNPENLWVDPIQATAKSFSDWPLRHARRLGRRLVPIGATYRDHLALLFSDDGSFYGCYNELLYLLGTSFDQTLAVLMTQHGFVDVSHAGPPSEP